MFVCALCWYPAGPGWAARSGCVAWPSGLGCAPLLLAGVLGPVCVCVRPHPVPRQSWLVCAVWLCVLGLGFRLRPATPGWGVWVSVCLRARSVYTPSIQARVCGVGVCASAGASAAPRHSWLGFWAVCVFVCALRLYLANPGWAARCGCVFLGSGFGCAPPLLAWVLGCVCRCAPSACTSPLLAGLLGCVCVCLCASLVPRQSLLECLVWVCVLGFKLRLGPAFPGWAVGVFVCLCARSACTPQTLAGVRGVGVCAWALALAAPRPSWLGWWGLCVFVCALLLSLAKPGWGMWCGCVCLGSGSGCAPPFLAGLFGCVCVCLCASLVPRRSSLGCALWVCVLGLGFRLPAATPD